MEQGPAPGGGHIVGDRCRGLRQGEAEGLEALFRRAGHGRGLLKTGGERAPREHETRRPRARMPCAASRGEGRILAQQGAAPALLRATKARPETPRARAGRAKERGASPPSAQEQPVVAPQVTQWRQVPLRTRVKLPHSWQASPENPCSRARAERSLCNALDEEPLEAPLEAPMAAPTTAPTAAPAAPAAPAPTAAPAAAMPAPAPAPAALARGALRAAPPAPTACAAAPPSGARLPLSRRTGPIATLPAPLPASLAAPPPAAPLAAPADAARCSSSASSSSRSLSKVRAISASASCSAPPSFKPRPPGTTRSPRE